MGRGKSTSQRSSRPTAIPNSFTTMHSTFENIEKAVPSELQPLVLKFFLVFSRFEFALKAAGYHKKIRARRNSGMPDGVGPDWESFAAAIESQFPFAGDLEVETAIDYFKTHPPMQQILNGSRIVWASEQESGKRDSADWALAMVKRVRNNLFHGGKYPFAFVEEPSRNGELLNHSLVILQHCLSLSDRVADSFRQQPIQAA